MLAPKIVDTWAIAAFHQVLGLPVSRVIVGEIPPQSELIPRLGRFLLALSPEIRGEIEQARVQKEGASGGWTAPTAQVQISGKDESDNTEVEQNIAAIWCEVLGFEEINVLDNFFVIGGHFILIATCRR